MSITPVTWPLGNGNTLTTEVYSIDADFNSVPGIYIFAEPIGQDWYAKYIGQTKDFNSRVHTGHKKWAPAQKLGARYVNCAVVHSQQQRDYIEALLIKSLRPPLNIQLSQAAPVF